MLHGYRKIHGYVYESPSGNSCYILAEDEAHARNFVKKHGGGTAVSEEIPATMSVDDFFKRQGCRQASLTEYIMLMQA